MKLIGRIPHSPRLVAGFSWGLTLLLVAMLVGLAVWRLVPMRAVAAPEPTATGLGQPVTLPELPSSVPGEQAIVRLVALKTEIDRSVTYETSRYTVQRGDSVFKIASDHSIKPETLLWANYETLQDSPDSIRVGQVLNIPPVDGIYYQWQEGDTLQSIADEFEADPDAILNWPGNAIDLTNPTVEAGTYVMVPGGQREFVQWIIPQVARGSSGTANVGGAACGGGAYGSGGFIWPSGTHTVSGNEYWSGHLGIDITAGEGADVWAADSGVVTMAQSGWNYGYGNVVMIDHGNGYATLYGHLSRIAVSQCQSVAAGQSIGAAGNTGNSFGAHLHFEVRLNGGFVNPWYVLPPP